MKWFNIILGLLIALMGSLPFVGNNFSVLKNIPSSGDAYSIIIIILGILIVVVNFQDKRRRIRLR